jgi:anthranilate/para-aminobenzoate synthase component I
MSTLPASPESPLALIACEDGFSLYQNPIRARLFYRNHGIDLLTGERIFGIDDFWRELEGRKLFSSETTFITQLFYECGAWINQTKDSLSDDLELALDLEFSSNSEKPWQPSSAGFFELKEISSPSFEEYLKAFNNGHHHLLNGNCYQYNLTFPFKYKIECRDWRFLPEKLWEKKKSRGAMAWAIYLPQQKRLLLSNTPECLYRVHPHCDGHEILSMPIKGTQVLLPTQNSDEVFQELANDKKNDAELVMITDLVRNDLSRIDLPNAKVYRLKQPLLVPGLVHQHSVVGVKVSADIKQGRVLSALFPGGSITGAPKKRVMQILDELEQRARASYCGSLVFSSEKESFATINIRTSEVDFKKSELLYQAGGGVTLLSSPESEFSEMLGKVGSFIGLLAPLGAGEDMVKLENRL